MKNRNKILLLSFIVLAVVINVIGLYIADYYGILPKKTYVASDFNIEVIHSEIDYNRNSIDDYTDFVLGARKDAKNHPTYDDTYYGDAYPPNNIGVCTDVVWRAFKNAGYGLREMVDNDIIERPNAYTKIEKRDNNIDFRRVVNLHVFFEKHAISLTLDENQIEEWQPGDIVIFNNDKHIGIVSDKRNKKGQVYIIHNSGQKNREEDYLSRHKATAHYRFDASIVPENIIEKWSDEGE